MPSPSAKYSAMGLSNIGGINGLLASSVKGNSEIKPERTAETEFGVDFSIMGGFATVEATMYTQKISDLILLVDMPASSGFSSSWENGGEMETKGTEFTLGLKPMDVGGLKWNFQMTYYKSESEVTKLTVDPYNYGGFADFLGTYRIEEGWAPTAIVGMEMDSVGLSFDSVFVNEVFTGFDTSTVYQHRKLGDENPDYRISFQNSFKYGPIEFSFLIDHKEGGSAINLANLIYDFGGTTADYEEQVLSGNRLETWPLTYTQPYIESTTYTMLRDVSLTYTLPKNLSDVAGVGYLKLGLAGRNLWLDTDYTGISPEVSQFGNEAVGGSIDTNPFPQSKSVYLTLSVGI
jgi:hypothetical protein